jgi:hypothetical protein
MASQRRDKSTRVNNDLPRPGSRSIPEKQKIFYAVFTLSLDRCPKKYLVRPIPRNHATLGGA